MEKTVVGQTLFSLNVGNSVSRITHEQSLTPVIVKKVGRKYFVCGVEDSDWHDLQYHLDSWQQKTEYCADSVLYKTEQEWLDEFEAKKLSEQIENSFRLGRNLSHLPLESLRKIVEIIEKDSE